MCDDDFDMDFRKRVYGRSLEEQNSNFWNYKRYYTAASFWGWVDVGSSAITAVLGAILTFGLAWRQLPLWMMVSFSLTIGIIAIFKGNRKPGHRAEKLHSIGRAYQELHDEIRDFVELDLKDEDRDKEWLRQRFNELAKERHNLKAEAKLSGFWYWLLKLWKGEDIYLEGATTDEERELLDPDGFFEEDEDE